MNRAHRLHAEGQQLSSELFKATGYAATPTVDGRVLVYAPRKGADTALSVVQRRIQGRCRTARLVDVGDDRLAVVEVSSAGR